jgi:hypothetical protein
MVLSGIIIDSIPIDSARFVVTGYLEQLRLDLIERNPDIECPQRNLHFYVDNVPSSLNKK